MGKIILNEIDYSGGNANVIRLTQAEYDALPPSKLTDNNIYMITDTNGDGSQFQPVIYSENEREIGVWTDGKPLYQKTLLLTTPSTTDDSIVSDLSLLQIDVVTDIKGVIVARNELTSQIIPIFWSHSSQLIGTLYFDIDGKTLRQKLSTDTYLSKNEFVTIQYTKTTDTAGSGTWTPQGVPAVHYSTDEQVVGTWIDGSTIYEKTFELSNTVATTANSWSTISGINLSGDEDWILQTIVYLNTDKSAKVGFGKNDNGVFKYFDTVQLAIDKITIQYTKTSQGGN